MALGKRQQEFIDKILVNMSYNYYLDAYYVDRYFNSRETGRGYPVMLRLTYLLTGQTETRWEIARCQTEDACSRKVDEIDQYIYLQLEKRRRDDLLRS